ncbi:Growth_factor receptor cysteine-rich domain superfamily [Hexamita inflata]|uniref:Growth factor receptor cysteine-rich domain superfamily n=1 Tax=Hexamita inflata TaxID=28002 RepID=A0AA86QH97_9EUKA|nr:Growth factor receptor cysteine-rich domain superfamily [Hexamita inflata]
MIYLRLVLLTCPLDQIFDTNLACSSCVYPQIPNSAQSLCVSDCGTEFLSTNGNYCVVSCAGFDSVPDANNQCQPCAYKISADSYHCVQSCPIYQLSINNRCISCSSNMFPNVDKSACFSSCAPNYLYQNSFCVISCSVFNLVGVNSICVPCSAVNPLSTFNGISNSCESTYECKNGFVLNINQCVCPYLLQGSGTKCVQNCENGESILNGNCVPKTKSACSNQIFRNGVLYSFCVKGAQNNRKLNITFQLAGVGGLAFEAEIFRQVQITGEYVGAGVSLNIFSNLVVISSKINFYVATNEFGGINAFGLTQIIDTEIQINGTAKKITVIGQHGKQNSIHCLIEKTAINARLNATNICLLESVQYTTVAINQTNIEIIIAADTYIGLSQTLNASQIDCLTMNVTTNGQVDKFYGMSIYNNDMQLSSCLVQYVTNSISQFCGISMFARGHQNINGDIQIIQNQGRIVLFYCLFKQVENVKAYQLILSIYSINGNLSYCYGFIQQATNQLTFISSQLTVNIQTVKHIFTLSQSAHSLLFSDSVLKVIVDGIVQQFYGITEAANNQMTIQQSNISVNVQGYVIYALAYVINFISISNFTITGTIQKVQKPNGLIGYIYESITMKQISYPINLANLNVNKFWNVHYLQFNQILGIQQNPYLCNTADQETQSIMSTCL